MQCRFCGTDNLEQAERCRRCQGRLAAPPATSGALAMQPELFDKPSPKVIPFARPAQESFAMAAAAPAPAATNRSAAALAPAVANGSAAAAAAPAPAIRTEPPASSAPVARPQSAPPAPAAPPPRQRRPAPPPARVQQAEIEFHSASIPVPRQLKTSVDSKVCADVRVAGSVHRAIAGAADMSLVLIAFGIFLAALYYTAGPIVLDRPMLAGLAIGLALITLLYGFLFAMGNAPTAGMCWTRLRLVNFDGIEPDRRQRMVRFFGACLSFGSAGLGVLWALLDEETLAWHDHISETFPAVEESASLLVRRV